MGAIRQGVVNWTIDGTSVFGEMDTGEWYLLDTRTGERVYLKDRDAVEKRLRHLREKN